MARVLPLLLLASTVVALAGCSMTIDATQPSSNWAPPTLHAGDQWIVEWRNTSTEYTIQAPQTTTLPYGQRDLYTWQSANHSLVFDHETGMYMGFAAGEGTTWDGTLGMFFGETTAIPTAALDWAFLSIPAPTAPATHRDIHHFTYDITYTATGALMQAQGQYLVDGEPLTTGDVNVIHRRYSLEGETWRAGTDYSGVSLTATRTRLGAGSPLATPSADMPQPYPLPTPVKIIRPMDLLGQDWAIGLTPDDAFAELAPKTSLKTATELNAQTILTAASFSPHGRGIDMTARPPAYQEAGQTWTFRFCLLNGEGEFEAMVTANDALSGRSLESEVGATEAADCLPQSIAGLTTSMAGAWNAMGDSPFQLSEFSIDLLPYTNISPVELQGDGLAPERMLVDGLVWPAASRYVVGLRGAMVQDGLLGEEQAMTFAANLSLDAWEAQAFTRATMQG